METLSLLSNLGIVEIIIIAAILFLPIILITGLILFLVKKSKKGKNKL